MSFCLYRIFADVATSGAEVSTAGLWHYPARIIDPTIATAFATFSPASGFPTTSIAGIINKISGRQQVSSQKAQNPDYFNHDPTDGFLHWIFNRLECHLHIPSACLDSLGYKGAMYVSILHANSFC